MHEIQMTVPQGMGQQVASLALKSGIQEVAVSQVFVHGPEQNKDQVSIQTETPTAKAFLDALITADFFNPQDYNFSSQTVSSLISSQKPEKLTAPFHLPITDVYEDLWMSSQINPSYVARAMVSSLLLSYGMLQNDLITMIAAFLFTPFLAQILAGSFGLITRQWRLALQGALALALSTLLTILSGFIVASLTGGPLKFDSFSSLLVNFLVSLVSAVVAGLATGDASGRRELIAMAAAAQFAVYPAWFGIMLVLGLPGPSLVGQRWLTFLVNVATILVVSTGVYLLMRYQGDVLQRYAGRVRKGA